MFGVPYIYYTGFARTFKKRADGRIVYRLRQQVFNLQSRVQLPVWLQVLYQNTHHKQVHLEALRGATYIESEPKACDSIGAIPKKAERIACGWNPPKILGAVDGDDMAVFKVKRTVSSVG